MIGRSPKYFEQKRQLLKVNPPGRPIRIKFIIATYIHDCMYMTCRVSIINY